MRTLLICVLLILCHTSRGQQENITLLSHWNDPNLPVIDGDQVWNDIMGWNDTIKNKEYIIAGSNDSIYFFDITNPNIILKCDVEEGHARNAINRDYEVYDHYVYCVSDRSSPLGGLQIFDLQYLPDSVHKVYDSDSLTVNTHTLFIDAPSKRLYLCGSSMKAGGIRSLAVFNLSNPELPAYLGELDKSLGCGYTHEMFAKNDTVYLSCGYPGLFIFDLRDMNNQLLIGSITPPYAQNGYNHSSWLDSTGKYLMFTDEVPNGLGIKIFDIHDIGNPNFITVFNTHIGATPHNAYWNGRFAYISVYEDGVYIFDLKDIGAFMPNQIPPVAGYYDTYPKNAAGVYNGFHGCWGVWPFLKSGNIIASDISEGIFVLKPANNLSDGTDIQPIISLQAFPNPFTNQVNLQIQSRESGEMQFDFTNLLGEIIHSSNANLQADLNHVVIPTSKLNVGMYILQSTFNGRTISRKLIKN